MNLDTDTLRSLLLRAYSRAKVGADARLELRLEHVDRGHFGVAIVAWRDSERDQEVVFGAAVRPTVADAIEAAVADAVKTVEKKS